MMNESARQLLETHLEMARTTENDTVAEVQLNIAAGMLAYASTNGDLAPREFFAESQTLKLIREQRRLASIAKGGAHA